ncbi:CU044_5270 family protein [Agromyces sp. SYSU K20354]|uniref:CU044_5270 family protein n=1 Tax=Agromyces cavernae TaxID=2898659 RepID=UPI001E4537C0|nr:CU044_5270 family protein [Agromyces cavernae]MCD2441821.1 CU044_5270 family protein [Agromyces cavernae]
MDELLLLRRARSDVEPPSAEVVAGARAALMERVQTETSIDAVPRVRHRVRRIGFATLGTLAAGGLVAGLVFTNMLGLAGWRGGADAAAASVLHDAAIATLGSEDPILEPGQYLRIDQTAVYGATNFTDDEKYISYLTISHEELYVPANPEGDWVWIRPLSKTYETFGPESAAIAEENELGSVEAFGENSAEIVRAPGGAFYSMENQHSPSALKRLPTDPYQLLNYIYRTTLGQGPSPDQEALVWIADTLRSGAVPAQLRSAMYQAAALIPGVEITERQANLDGRVGVAIGRYEESNGIRQDIIIDPETGAIIGQREVQMRDEPFNSFPAGTVIAWTAITSTVVDAAPKGGTVDGAFEECELTAPGTFSCPME